MNENYITNWSRKSRRIAQPVETQGNVSRQNLFTQAGMKPTQWELV